MRPGRVAVPLLLVVAGLSACTSSAATASPPTSTTASPSVPDDAGRIPVAHGGSYVGAVTDFGADRVAGAVDTAAQVARIALADCVRWTTGEVDPRLTALVAPELIDRSLAELERSREYGGTPLPSLLSHLPSDDGNGHDLAAELARAGCDGSAPLHFPSGPLRVRARPGGGSALVVSGGFALNVAFGATLVSAGQEWDFTLEADADGWRLTDVGPVTANVNWAPEMTD